MADLLDISPATAVEVVKIGDLEVTVRGLGVVPVTSIVARFPKMIGLLLGGLTIGDIGSQFVQQFGAATAPIIAAGCGHLGDEQYEQRANDLLFEDQLKLVMAVIKVTCPNGFGFFAEMVTQLTTAATGEEAKTVKVRSKKSPLPSQPLSDEGSHQNIQ